MARFKNKAKHLPPLRSETETYKPQNSFLSCKMEWKFKCVLFFLP